MPTIRMPLDQSLVEDLVCTPASRQQDFGALVDLLGQAVIEVVVHLSGQLVIAQRREVDLVVVQRFGHVIVGHRRALVR